MTLGFVSTGYAGRFAQRGLLLGLFWLLIAARGVVLLLLCDGPARLWKGRQFSRISGVLSAVDPG